MTANSSGRFLLIWNHVAVVFSEGRMTARGRHCWGVCIGTGFRLLVPAFIPSDIFVYFRPNLERKIMDFLEENKPYFYLLGILVTIVTLIISTKYTLSNIKRIWDAGRPRSAVADEKETIPGIIPSEQLEKDVSAGILG